MQTVYLKKAPTTLSQLLKFENLVQSGGEAKFVITEGLVRVNGEVETRKGRKIGHGDVVEFEGTSLKIVAGSQDDQQPDP